MGPSKPSLSGAPFASTTQLYRNEGKTLQTQLQFNRNVPAVPENLALRFSNPCPIIIEKLKSSKDQRNLSGSDNSSIKSSGKFSIISEERLKLAIQLAKRDIKRKHLEEQVKQKVLGDAVNKSLLTQKSQQQKNKVFESPEKKSVLKSQTELKYQGKLGQSSSVETTASGAKVYLYTPSEGKLTPAVLGSLPAHNMRPDPKPNVNKKEDKSRQEIQRLQKELRSCIQKIEELIKKERDEEILNRDEEQQVCTRRQKQASRSARMLYVLQQQVKEIQDDLEKLSPHEIKHTKKSQAVSRLAAAHRGAIRALQAFANQFTDQTEQLIPTHYKELGSLIRQLSLCSAKLEVDSSVSDIIIDILLQIEDLDSLLEKKQAARKSKKCLTASQHKSPVNTETSPDRKQLTSPKGEKKSLILKEKHGQEPRKFPASRDKHQRVTNISAVQKMNSHAHILHNKFQEENDLPTPERNAVLKGSIDSRLRSRAVKKDLILESGPLKKKDVILPAKSQGMLKPLKPRQVQPQGKHAQFQETTIAFQLKENKRLVKESRIPWVPPNPTSPPASPKRAHRISRTASSKKLIHKHSALQKGNTEERRVGFMEKEALRLAWLEAGTSRRMKVLTDLSKGEMEKIKKLRSQGASPTQYVDKVEKAVQKRIEPLLDRAQQVAANADILSEKVLDDLLEDTAQELWNTEQQKKLQAEEFMADSPSLETMLQRMEEIERYQAAVCRRFTQIVYSDSKFWAQEMDQQSALTAKIPTSPHPIHITKLTQHVEPETDILIEKLFDDNDTDENEEAKEKLPTGNDILDPLTQNSLQKECYISLPVTKDMLQSIKDYNSRYEHHLKLIFHEAVGGFNPWQIAESLAEELTEEALCDVAAELQDVCEDYAEAVFTSEFLQPAQ
ncbi:protein moonraker isoform X1 [Cygnus atratus]|uniref:protein moonraker isoform X1 n=1 Tax=Cygnus atratus TaxID=8868 RepID=UPI0015D5CB86|nr:protein moonraker isoform X1 [Cygnus atratus]XP_050570710.1 protein moonraker isoform X1 [Cygnus atratus]XP_050570711.1 protein moonraker isoform X1 [Cygnus atratus]XP_050570712.1 protein moonraker isoform X1 [Cygnus atratus]